jgi:hypothetical protein
LEAAHVAEGEDDKWEEGSIPVPSYVGTCLVELERCRREFGRSPLGPIITAELTAIATEATRLYDSLVSNWMGDDHYGYRRDRNESREKSDLPPTHFDWLAVVNSVLAPAAWVEYESAADHFGGKLPEPLSILFRFSRVLGRVN